MARPLKEINWDLVLKKMEAGCPAKEIYSGMCDEDTFYSRFKKEFGRAFSDYSGWMNNVGIGNLRYAQYAKAMQGNNQMLTLLGKERLGQGREEEIKKSPFEDIIELRHENMMLKAELQEIKQAIDAKNK